MDGRKVPDVAASAPARSALRIWEDVSGRDRQRQERLMAGHQTPSLPPPASDPCHCQTRPSHPVDRIRVFHVDIATPSSTEHDTHPTPWNHAAHAHAQKSSYRRASLGPPVAVTV